MTKKTGARVLLETIRRSDISLLTGYTGGAIMPVFDLLPKFKKNLTFIMSRHEQGAGFIAIGYYKASGRLMPVLTTSGPGATNTVTAVADAMLDSSGLFIITGQVSTAVIGSDAFQESDIAGIMYPITKQTVLITNVEELSETVEELINIALYNRPGPVCLDLPKNIQTAEMNPNSIPKKISTNYKIIENKPTEKEIRAFFKHIKSSRKPVILAGHGVINSNSYLELQELVNLTEIPITNTLHGVSSFNTKSKYFLGMMGMHGEIMANRAIQEADLLIALGMRFDDRVTGKLEEYGKNAKIIHIDIDKAELNKNVIVDLKIHANLKDTLSLLVSFIKKYNFIPKTKPWLKYLDKYRKISQENYKHIYNTGVGENGKLLMSRIVHELSKFTNGQDNIVTDVGQHQMFSAKHYNFCKYNSWFTSGGAGTMGVGLPMSIGVKLARPEEEVWCISGDGGFQMNIQELGTIMQYNININILLFNNSYLGMVKQWQDLFFDRNHSGTKLVNPNFKAICKGYGIEYRKIDKVEDIQDALKWSKNQKSCTLVEFICDEKELVFPMIPSNYSFDKIIYNEKHGKEILSK